MKKTGYILLQTAAYFILLGGFADLIMSFLFESLPAPHLSFLNINKNDVSPKFRDLDYALIRAIGCCLIAIGIGALTIIYGAIRKGMRWPLMGLIIMVTIGEGGNAFQMIQVKSPYFIFPFTCVMLMLAGAMFWWIGNGKEQRTNVQRNL